MGGNRGLKWRIARLKSCLSSSWIGRLAIRGWQWAKSLPNSTAFWLALVGTVLVCSILGLTYGGWDWLRPSSGGVQPSITTESRSTTIRNAGFVIAGALALIFAVWRSVVAQRQATASQSQADTALRQTETSQRQADTAQQGLLNERYQKGAEMLGNGVLAVRLGGIYALQRLAEEHPEQYHLQIMELLCAFVRFPTDDKTMDSFSHVVEEPDGHRETLRPDVQDAMRFLGSRSQEGIRLEQREGTQLYLRDANVSRLQTVDANLSHAWLTKANLSNAELRRADLSGARLRQAKLPNAMLYDANLSNADFGLADLSKARLVGADLTGASLYGVNLTGASFSNRGLAKIRAGTPNPAKGLTQAQLDKARRDIDIPPFLEGVLDAETGEQLVWKDE